MLVEGGCAKELVHIKEAQLVLSRVHRAQSCCQRRFGCRRQPGKRRQPPIVTLRSVQHGAGTQLRANTMSALGLTGFRSTKNSP